MNIDAPLTCALISLHVTKEVRYIYCWGSNKQNVMKNL